MRAEHVALGITGSIELMLLSMSPVVAQAPDGGYRVFRPDGPGPHPAVVFVSGCSGFTPAFAPKAYELRAEQLRALGFVVVWADFLGRRNLKNCEMGVTQEQAARDAIAAAAWLRSQPDIDATRIAAVGWSYGGGSVLAALGSHTPDQLIFSRVIAFYPYCGGGEAWSHRTPVLVLLAGDDGVAPHARCKPILDPSSRQGDVRIIEYPGALHSFDTSGLPPRMEYAYGTIGYLPEAAAAAWAEVVRFLQPAR